MKYKYEFFIFTGFFVLLILYFSPVLFGKSFFWEDFLYQNYPYRFFAAVSLRHGIFPFWNPYIFGGIPFFADVQSAVLYPFNLILTLFVHNNALSYRIVEFQDIFHLFLAGIFMYILLRYLKVSKISSTIAGLAYMLNGRFIVNLMHINTINTIIWLPLIVYFLMRAMEEKRVKYAIYGGISLGVSALAGYPQAVVMIIITTLIYFIIALFYVNKEHKWEGLLLNLKIYSILLFIGIGISAVQYVPTYKLFKLSPRSKYTYGEVVEGSFPPSHFITLLMPKIFGAPERGYSAFYYGRSFHSQNREPTHYYWDLCVYIGIIILILAIIGIIYIRTKLRIFILTIILFGVSFALGKYFFVHILFYKFIPFFKSIRNPVQYFNLYIFGMIFSAGIGLDSILKKTKSLQKHANIFLWLILFIPVIYIIFYLGFYRWMPANNYKINGIHQFARFGIIWALGISAIFLFLKNKMSERIFIPILSLLIIFDLFNFGLKFNNGDVNPYIFYFIKKIGDPSDRLINVIKKEQSKFIRISGRDYKVIGHESRFSPRNLGSIQQIFTINGYNPLQFTRRALLFSFLRYFNQLNTYFSLLGVKYYPIMNTQSNTFELAENNNYLPRVFLVSRYMVIKSEKKIFWAIKSEKINLHNEVILEKSPGIPILPSEYPEDVKIASYSSNKINIKANTYVPSILVLDDMYYPLWNAFIDGKKAEIIPADYVLRAVAVPAGKHHITFIYSKKMLIKGILLMIILEFIAFGIYITTKNEKESREQKD